MSQDTTMLDVSGKKTSTTPPPVAQSTGADAPQHTPRPTRPRDISCAPPKYRRRASPASRPSHPSVCGRRLRRYSL